LNDTIEFIRTGKIPETPFEEQEKDHSEEPKEVRSTSDLSFEDLSVEP
jgi:hypothetical protein